MCQFCRNLYAGYFLAKVPKEIILLKQINMSGTDFRIFIKNFQINFVEFLQLLVVSEADSAHQRTPTIESVKWFFGFCFFPAKAVISVFNHWFSDDGSVF